MFETQSTIGTELYRGLPKLGRIDLRKEYE